MDFSKITPLVEALERVVADGLYPATSQADLVYVRDLLDDIKVSMLIEECQHNYGAVAWALLDRLDCNGSLNKYEMNALRNAVLRLAKKENAHEQG